MEIRRRMLMGGKKVIDTSPKIAEYGKACAYGNIGERTESKLCVTEWYSFDAETKGQVYLYNAPYATAPVRFCNYQFYGTKSDGTIVRDWHYNISADNPRRIIGWNGTTLAEIRFSIPIGEIDDAYAYVQETGQIFFAGKNSPYYGYTNINDMPT